MQAVGLKTYIWNNNFRSALLLAGFPVLLIGLLWAGQLGLMGAGYLPHTGYVARDAAISAQWLIGSAPLALLASGGWYAVAFFGYQSIIDFTTGAHKVSRTEEPELWNLLENLCISRGLTMPDLRIVETDARNAWASGLSDKRAVVTVTRGLMQVLTKDELEAVLAHELTHVINRDSRVMVIAAIFAGIITLLAEMIARMMFYSGGRGSSRSRSEGGGGGAGALMLIGFGAAALGYVLAIAIRFAISRRREYLADAGAVELTKNPDAMISALLKISGHSDIHAPDDIQAMFIDNHERGFAGFQDTHPPIQKRVDALVKYAHGRLPDWQAQGFDPVMPQAPASGTAVPQTATFLSGTAVPPTSKGPWG
ncbi:MAG: M48 family metallopeptidase [Proteobacteria bacterium]|nr:M48 family metallopeptidase [Pseudomonadota bacterium]